MTNEFNRTAHATGCTTSEMESDTRHRCAVQWTFKLVKYRLASGERVLLVLSFFKRQCSHLRADWGVQPPTKRMHFRRGASIGERHEAHRLWLTQRWFSLLLSYYFVRIICLQLRLAHEAFESISTCQPTTKFAYGYLRTEKNWTI